MIIVNVILVLLALFYMTRRFGFSFGTFFTLFFFVCHVSAFFIYSISSLILNDFTQVYDLFSNISIIPSFAIASFIMGYVLVVALIGKKTNDILSISSSNRNKEIFIAIVFMTFWVGASIAYIAKAGVSFDAGDYEGRLEKNAGNGFFIMFMIAYIPAVVIIYLLNRSKRNLFFCCMLAAFCGVVYFYVIGGSRNVFVAGIFVLIVMGYYDRHISKVNLAIIAALGILSLNGLVFLRYGISIDEIDAEFVVKFLSYLADSISPIKALDRIVTYYEFNDNIQYFSLFFNKFEAFVPRFLWPDKPINTMTAAYFYTVEIYGLDGYLTMAPTILGSSIIMFGLNFYWLVFLIIGAIIAVLDNMLKSQNLYFKVIALTAMPFSFFLTRESLELFVFNVMKYIIVISFCFAFAIFIYFVLPKGKKGEK
tara:strand:+ start:8800 stop:10068 length:1269 start_codon:yes stop_codon:yes gene_type:complete